MHHCKKQTVLAVLAALAGGISATSFAQQVSKGERIEVTGSNIKRVDAETASPIQILKREDIEKSGATSISEVIRSLPVDNNGSISDAFGSGFAAGASGVSLRGLTVSSTLVLLNGRRMAPYGLADDGQRSFVDLNSIPLDAVDRIEILKDGASAVYGSDAIAGVINVILRKDFQGAMVNASTGMSRHGDGKEHRLSITAGKGDPGKDRFNAFVNVELMNRDAIEQRSRGAYVGTDDLRGQGWYDARGGNPLDPFSVSTSSIVGNVRSVNANGGAPVGPFQPLAGCAPANLDQGFCRWSITDYLQIQPEVKRANFLGRLTYRFSDSIESYFEAGLFTTKTKTVTTPSSSSTTWANVRDLAVVSSSNLFLPVGHPDNPFNAANQGARLRYVFGDVGPRRNGYETAVTRVIGGVRGASGGWDWDAGAGYVQSESDRTADGYIRYSVLQELIASGTYRFGVNAHLNSAQTYARLAPTLESSSKSSTSFVDLRASRELLELPGGALAIALGGDLRNEKLDSPGTPYTFEGDIMGLGYSSFKGDRNVTAAHVELVAPVLNSLELNAAARIDHYSDVGNSTTPKLGVKWTPLKSLAVRATYSEGFRAPGPAESGDSSNAAYTTFRDPVRCVVTSDPRDCGGASTVVLSTGNTAIKPETSKSVTFGVIFEPAAGTSIAVDAYRIERRDEILGADANAILQNPGAYPGAAVVRDEPDTEHPNLPGRVLAVSAPYLNGPQTRTSGIDLDMAQRFNLGASGRLTANLIVTYVKSFLRTLPNGTASEYVGTHGPTALSGNGGTPRTRATFRLSWDQGPATLTGITNYVSGMRGIESTGGECLNPDNYHNPEECRIPSFTTFDLTGSYKVSRQLEIYGAIRNVFDRLPPYDPQTYGAVNYNPTFHLAGAIGRFFTLGGRYTF
jgi:iron complex outermembrane receptor protein